MSKAITIFFIIICGTTNSISQRYIPEPQTANTPYLIGALYFPGWKQGAHLGWEKIVPFPERKPTLGWYDEGNPEVADWEIKWSVEHGISFFVYCWYRIGEDKPVQTYLGHAIHDGLFKAKYRNKFQFAIMWENANGKGVSSEYDLLNNLFPYWVDTYFKKPYYLKVDGKPVLFIYNIDGLFRNLGNADNVHFAVEKMRSASKAHGFAGLILLCEYRGQDSTMIKKIKSCGFDDIFAYCWPVHENNPTPATSVQTQIDYLCERKNMPIIPFVPTISMGWDAKPWNPADMQHWQIPPLDFKKLCQGAKTVMSELPKQCLGRRMLIIDNWNEWGEGHYIAPCEQYGFGYLDAVRETFTNAPIKHRDLVPADIGRGPYDSLFRRANPTESPVIK